MNSPAYKPDFDLKTKSRARLIAAIVLAIIALWCLCVGVVQIVLYRPITGSLCVLAATLWILAAISCWKAYWWRLALCVFCGYSLADVAAVVMSMEFYARP